MSDRTSLLPLRFRKRPVVIEAVQLTPQNVDAVREWLGPAFKRFADLDGAIRISTLEGVLLAKPPDWIVKGVEGEFYPVRADIFEKTYEAVYV